MTTRINGSLELRQCLEEKINVLDARYAAVYLIYQSDINLSGPFWDELASKPQLFAKKLKELAFNEEQKDSWLTWSQSQTQQLISWGISCWLLKSNKNILLTQIANNLNIVILDDSLCERGLAQKLMGSLLDERKYLKKQLTVLDKLLEEMVKLQVMVDSGFQHRKLMLQAADRLKPKIQQTLREKDLSALVEAVDEVKSPSEVFIKTQRDCIDQISEIINQFKILKTEKQKVAALIATLLYRACELFVLEEGVIFPGKYKEPLPLNSTGLQQLLDFLKKELDDNERLHQEISHHEYFESEFLEVMGAEIDVIKGQLMLTRQGWLNWLLHLFKCLCSSSYREENTRKQELVHSYEDHSHSVNQTIKEYCIYKDIPYNPSLFKSANNKNLEHLESPAPSILLR